MKGLSITNLDADTDVFWGDETCTSDSFSDAVMARGGRDIELDGYLPIYLIAEDTGAATSAADRFGAATLNNNGVTSPDDLLTLNDTRATFDDQADNVEVNGFTAAVTLPVISQVKLKLQARKGTNATTETVALDGSGSGRTTGSGTITSDGNIPGGSTRKVLVFISRNASNTITGVTAGGVTLAQLAAKVTIGGRDHECWWGYGTFAASGVIVTMSSSTNAHIAWFQFSNTDAAAPLLSAGATGTGTAVMATGVSGTNLGFAVMSVSHESASGIAGAGYTERTDETNGTGSNIDGLYTETKPLVVTASETGTATLDSSSTWSALTATVAPKAAADPVLTVSYHVGSNPDGPTTLVATLSATSDTDYEADITGDEVWTAAKIATTVVKVTATTLTAADAEVDCVYLGITETEADVSAHCTYSWLGEP